MNSDHKTDKQILIELKEAKEKIEIGGLYAHYKDSSKTYRVKGFGTLEADDSLCVIYQAQYGARLTFIRPADIWLEQVEWSGNKVPRFKRI